MFSDQRLPCQENPELWFSEDRLERRAAVGICGTCPVQQECASLALESGEDHGVWGGSTPKDRRQLTKAAA